MMTPIVMMMIMPTLKTMMMIPLNPLLVKKAMTTIHIHALLAGHTTASSIKAFTNQAKREYDKFFFLRWPLLIPYP